LVAGTHHEVLAFLQIALRQRALRHHGANCHIGRCCSNRPPGAVLTLSVDSPEADRCVSFVTCTDSAAASDAALWTPAAAGHAVKRAPHDGDGGDGEAGFAGLPNTPAEASARDFWHNFPPKCFMARATTVSRQTAKRLIFESPRV
jgi:hypothetical protein